MGFAIAGLASSCGRPFYGETAVGEARIIAADKARQVAPKIPPLTSAMSPSVPGGTAPSASADAGGFFPGHGELINSKAASRPVQVISARGGITLNFIDADVRDVVRTVLGGTLNLNYAIDAKVKGTITLQTSSPIGRSAVLPTLESVLRLNGIGLVRVDGIYHVLPIAAASRGMVAPRLGHIPTMSGEAFGVRIVPLKHVSAAEMSKILEPLVSKGAILRIDADRNLIIFGGTGRERQTVMEIVEIFDVDWLSGMSFALYPLKFASPKEVVADLKKVFGSLVEGPLGGLIRFYPVSRSNSLLVVTSNAEYLEKAEVWIERLDIGEDLGERRLFVYRVENSRAVDIADILGKLFLSGVATSQSTSGTASSISSSRISSGRQASSLPTSQTATPQARTAGPPLNALQVSPVRPSRAAPSRTAEVPATATQVARAAPIGVAAISEDARVRIVADEANNTLVILATRRQYRMISGALRQLDIVPLQVLIEATIAEVTLKDELKFGIQWFLKSNTGKHLITLSEAADGAVASTFPGFSYLLSGGRAQAVLNALRSVTDVNVVSSPQLMVLNNHTAELLVGDQVPVATQSSVSSTDPDAPTVNTIQFRDTGIVLTVTPRVNASGLVTMDISQEVSTVVKTTTSGIDSPTIQQRRIKTSVVVQSGETVALGGLIKTEKNLTGSGIPFLSSIPILGNLFKTETTEDNRTELLVLITPRVVRNQAEARAVTDELRRMLSAPAALERRSRGYRSQ